MAPARRLAPLICILVLGSLLSAPALWTELGHAADRLEFAEIAPGLYVHQGAHEEATPENHGGIANVGFIVGTEAVAVIDSGGSHAQGQALRQALRQVTDLPIRYVILTHVHPDHVFGTAAFRDDAAIIIGHAKLPRAMAARGAFYLEGLERNLGTAAAGTDLVPPTETVADVREIDLGDRPLTLTAHPTAHTDNDLSIYDATTRTLWLADLLFMDRVPVIDGNLKGWLRVIEDLRDLRADRVVPGHGPLAAPWPAAAEPQIRYLKTLLDEIRAIISRNGTMEEAVDSVGKSEAGKWLLFDSYHPRNVVTAFAELEWE